MPGASARDRTRKIAIGVGALVVIGVILWADVATGLWNDLAIVSGLAAGLVTFLLTVLVLDRIVARSTERKWAPVNRLALSEFLHAIADEEHSEISRGHIVPRTLATLSSDLDGAGRDKALHMLRQQVVHERSCMAEALSRWAEFLASSGDNQRVLRHIAEIALRLDRVRDAAVEAEKVQSSSALATLDRETQLCNTAMLSLESELRSRISHEDRLARARELS